MNVKGGIRKDISITQQTKKSKIYLTKRCKQITPFVNLLKRLERSKSQKSTNLAPPFPKVDKSTDGRVV